MSTQPGGHFFTFQRSVVNHKPSWIPLVFVPSFCPPSIPVSFTSCVQQNSKARLCALNEMDDNALLSICVFARGSKRKGWREHRLVCTALNAHWPPFQITNEWPQRAIYQCYFHMKKIAHDDLRYTTPPSTHFFLLFLSTSSSSSSFTHQHKHQGNRNRISHGGHKRTHQDNQGLPHRHSLLLQARIHLLCKSKQESFQLVRARCKAMDYGMKTGKKHFVKTHKPNCLH